MEALLQQTAPSFLLKNRPPIVLNAFNPDLFLIIADRPVIDKL